MELNKYIKFTLSQLFPLILILAGGGFYITLIGCGVMGLTNQSTPPGAAPMMLLVLFFLGTIIMAVSVVAAAYLQSKFK